jgi:hypothetical protein
MVPEEATLEPAHERHRVIRHRLVVGAHGGAHDHAVARGGVDIDGVEAHAPAGDDLEVRRALEDLLRVGLTARDRGEDAGQGRAQLILRHLAVAADASLDLKTGGLEPPEIGRVALVGVRDGDQDAACGHRSGLSHRVGVASRPRSRSGRGRAGRGRI